jgi:hypothetical protein
VKATAKTIQIFLPSGDPHGIRCAELTTRIVQVLEVPRALLSDFLQMPESEQVAAYFLFSQAGEGGESRVYIGQTGDLRARLAKHHQKKEFWERAVVLISRTNSLTQTHALFLEWYCLQEANKAGRYAVENGNGGSKPHTPAPLQADCLEIFETGRTLLSTLGYPVFDTVAGDIGSGTSKDIFFCRAEMVDGRGLYTPEGFVVLKDSVGRSVNQPSMKGRSEERLRQRLLDANVMRIQGKSIVFAKNHVFGSPSMAASALLGRTANGWTTWKSKDGRTLHEMKREGAEADA